MRYRMVKVAFDRILRNCARASDGFSYLVAEGGTMDRQSSCLGTLMIAVWV